MQLLQTASKHKGDMWRTWDALKGRPALMFPGDRRKQLEAEQAVLDSEAEAREQASTLLNFIRELLNCTRELLNCIRELSSPQRNCVWCRKSELSLTSG